MKFKKTAVGVLAASAAAYSAFSVFAFHEVFSKNAKIPGMINDKEKKKSKVKNPQKQEDPRVKWMHEQEFTPYQIKNDRGETLCGFLRKADTESNRYVLCSHGYRSRGKGEFRFISKFYHDIGYNIFLVDHIASGDSEGKYISFGYYEHRDLRLWVDFLLETFGKDIDIAVHGISMGCATVMMLAGNYTLPDNVKFIVADCGYTNAQEQFENVLRSSNVPPQPLLGSVGLVNRLVQGFSLKEAGPYSTIKNVTLPVLFVHGKNDGFVSMELTLKMYDACESEKDILLVEKAGHAQSYIKATEAYEKKIIEFTEKYIGKVTVPDKHPEGR